MSLGLTGCVIGTWRMHPGADMARIEDVCDTTVVCVGGECSCQGHAEVVEEPSPVAWNVGALAGRSTSAVGSGSSPLFSFEGEFEVSYVLPGDRTGIGLQAVYERELDNSPDNKSLDAMVGWGGMALVHRALRTDLVVHGGAGLMKSHYELSQGESNEVDTDSVLAERLVAGLTYIMARNARRDFFVVVQGELLHVPDVMAGTRELGGTGATISMALGLGLAP